MSNSFAQVSFVGGTVRSAYKKEILYWCGFQKQEKLDFLKAITESHNSHITKLEIMLRMLDNDSLDSDTIFGVTDDFKFYLDKADEGQLEDIQYIYEGIDLEETRKTGFAFHH